MAPSALVITGATATGKTALAIDVAQRLDGEIISMDSRQVYRGMDIGTAKPTLEQQVAVPHHGVDLVEPDQRYSAGRFAADARRWIEEITGRGRVPILAGGTGFFLRALTHPLFRQPRLAPRRRSDLERWLSRRPLAKLRRWLEVLDPATAAMLERAGGRQRIERALEIALLSGHALSWWHAQSPPEAEPLQACIFVLELPRDLLYRRIDDRVVAMVEDGLVEEVERLLEEGYAAADPGMTATGYAELVPYFEGRRTLDEATLLIQRNTRRYARRQLTWFRHQLPRGVLRLDARRSRDDLSQEIVRRWREQTS